MIGLCLSGGGSKGAFEVGVIEYLAENPSLYPTGFDRGAGTSVGAINLAGLAQFPPGPTQLPQVSSYMVKCWDALASTSDVWTKKFPPYLAGLWNPSIGDNTPLRKLLMKQIDYSRASKGTPCEVAAFDLLSGKGIFFSLSEAASLEELVSETLASSAFPLAFPPEKISSYFCTDGGITNIAPVGRLIDSGCDKILAISCSNPDIVEKKEIKDFSNVIDVGSRCLDGMEDEIIRGDLEKVRLWNLLVEAGHPEAKGKRKIEFDLIQPLESLGDPLDFSPDQNKKKREIGRETARKFFSSRLASSGVS